MPADPPPGDNIFGLAASRDQAQLRLLPVPFDATASYGAGAAAGPAAMLAAGAQLDLHDSRYGRVDRAGIFMDEAAADVGKLNDTVRRLTGPIFAAGETGRADPRTIAEINAAGAWVNRVVGQWCDKALLQGVIPGVLGGEHSVSFGAIKACAAACGDHGLGLLQIDAHMDLRKAYLSMEWSHASVIRNVCDYLPGVIKIVQIGIRDYSSEERRFADRAGGRIHVHTDWDWFLARDRGVPFAELCALAIEPLPQNVYITFDIDGLDPSLCPGTGTPVPGGLSFNQACLLLHTAAASGRRIVGFDLVEVAPGRDQFDANIGMRLLYQLCGAALQSQGRLGK